LSVDRFHDRVTEVGVESVRAKPVGVVGGWVSVVGDGDVVVGGGGDDDDDDEHASVDTVRSFWPERLPDASYASTAIV
jgi:hypothetical protein